MSKKADVDVGLACGRYYLSVNGFVVAMEGDMCRDIAVPSTHWNGKLLEMVMNTTSAEREKNIKRSLSREDDFSSLPSITAEAEYTAQKLKTRQDHDSWVNERLKETWATVEASHHEMHWLWKEWSIEAEGFRKQDDRKYVYWEQLGRGFSEHIGAFRAKKESMPVVISGFWAKIRQPGTTESRLILFWELCSQVRDGRMAERYLKENLSSAKVNTDANNFHNVIHQLKDPR